MDRKTMSESRVTTMEMVQPNDTNTLANLMGGRLMHWMDIASAIAAQKHSNRVVVTVSADRISFHHPIRLGNVVTLTAMVTRSFRTSMEVYATVEAEDIPSGTKFRTNDAFFTFVALDGYGSPVRVPEVFPEEDWERELYEGALSRRQTRLKLDA